MDTQIETAEKYVSSNSDYRCKKIELLMEISSQSLLFDAKWDKVDLRKIAGLLSM